MIRNDSAQFLLWNQKVASMMLCDEPEQLPRMLVEAVQGLLPHEVGLVVLFDSKGKAVNLFDNVPKTFSPEHVDGYLSGPYLLDPFYRAAIEEINPGLYTLKEVAPAGFEQSEFYNIYYKDSKCKDELGFITYLPDGYFANVSFVNVTHSIAYQQEEVEALRRAQPIVEAVLGRFYQYWSSSQREQGQHLHKQLEAALSIFASSILTPRECEVIRFYLHGHNTRSISERLNISPHTVSLHRKNSYAKLDINSQAELFHLFIDSLTCYDEESGRDPLGSYFFGVSTIEN